MLDEHSRSAFAASFTIGIMRRRAGCDGSGFDEWDGIILILLGSRGRQCCGSGSGLGMTVFSGDVVSSGARSEPRVDIRTYRPVVVCNQSCRNGGSSFKKLELRLGPAVFGFQLDVVRLSGAEPHAELRHGR
jgi:hypothetical protein